MNRSTKPDDDSDIHTDNVVAVEIYPLQNWWDNDDLLSIP